METFKIYNIATNEIVVNGYNNTKINDQVRDKNFFKIKKRNKDCPEPVIKSRVIKRTPPQILRSRLTSTIKKRLLNQKTPKQTPVKWMQSQVAQINMKCDLLMKQQAEVSD